jgi:integrase
VRDVSTWEKRGEHEARALTPGECREWLAILDSSEPARRKDLPDFTRFLLGTGCRLGEGVGVRWEDLDLERHLLQVRRTVLRVKGQGLVERQPKTRSGVLTGAEGPVFPDRHGGYRDRNNIEADYRRVREGTGFEWVVPHVYRKTVATTLDQGGLSARMIADQLGHLRISMTQDVYMGRRAVDGSVASALEALLDVDESGDEHPAPAALSVVS